MTVVDQTQMLKQTLRHYYLNQRKQISGAKREKAATALSTRFLTAVPLTPEMVIAGYYPLKQEMDVMPLLTALAARGHRLALPVTNGPATAMEFARWQPSDVLQKKPGHAFREPSPEAERVVPDLVIVPLVAFDRKGHRLGFGAGYYDRTLEVLRAKHTIITIGVGYAVQEAKALPQEASDQVLDWVVTDKEAFQCG